MNLDCDCPLLAGADVGAITCIRDADGEDGLCDVCRKFCRLFTSPQTMSVQARWERMSLVVAHVAEWPAPAPDRAFADDVRRKVATGEWR